MSKPGKPPQPRLIDVDDTDQVIRLALGALFTTTAIARGFTGDLLQLAPAMVAVADALMHASRARAAPPPPPPQPDKPFRRA